MAEVPRDEFHLTAICAGRRVPAVLWVECPEAHGVELPTIFVLSVEGREFSLPSTKNHFRQLQDLRLLLEKEDILLCCFGCARNYYVYPMSEDCYGDVLAKLPVGRPSEGMFRIFDWDGIAEPVTVAEQERFHEAWALSFRVKLRDSST